MNLFPRFHRRLLSVCLALLPSAAMAQRPHGSVSANGTSGTYNTAADVSLLGTILNYNENSKAAPIGTHVLLQTANGTVDVHLGDARLLHASKLNLTQGMSVRFIGQSQAVGSSNVFMARLVQVGTQVVALRSVHGLPLAPGGARSVQAPAASTSATQGGAR